MGNEDMKKDIAIITWTDAAMHGSDSLNQQQVDEECGLIEGVAVGVIAKEDKVSITLAMDWFYNEKTYRQLHTYPKSGIHKIIRKSLITPTKGK